MTATEPKPNSPAKTGIAPERPIVFFDGVCGLCDRTVNFLLSADRRQSLLFAPLQGETAEALLNESQRDLKSMVFLTKGKAYRKSAAAVRILWTLGGCWQVAAGLLWLIPGPVRDLGYNLVAQWRYRIFGKRETCRMPTPEERARFLP
jgi:predicted DCC family thiol-disulfide oxidoreductase YuxK